MGLFDFMYLVPKEQYQQMQQGQSVGNVTSNSIGGNVHDSRVNQIDMNAGGTVVIDGNCKDSPNQQKQTRIEASKGNNKKNQQDENRDDNDDNHYRGNRRVSRSQEDTNEDDSGEDTIELGAVSKKLNKEKIPPNGSRAMSNQDELKKKGNGKSYERA